MRELDKVIGYDSIKKDLYHIIDVLQKPEKYAALGVSIPKGILLSGEPGIGKSLMSKCFIKESGRKSYIIRRDRPDGGFVNYIRKVFEEAANNAPSIVFLDDMDKFANGDPYHRDAVEYVTVQSCIDEVKDKDVFVIATVNNYNNLPNSLVRKGRFDKTYEMQFPTGKDAVKIVSHYLSNKKVSEDVNVEDIVRICQGYSCVELETIINEACLYAGYEDRDVIGQKDLVDASLRHLYTVDEDEEVPKEVLKMRAVHEAGHLVVTEILEPHTVNFASVTAKTIGCGGCVSQNRKAGNSELFEGREAEIMISLAGKAAVEIIFQEIDLGSNEDMHEVFSSVRKLLDDNVAYDFSSWCHGHETSSQVYDHLDSVIAAEIARYYAETKKILANNRDFVLEIADRLVEDGTLTHSEIMKIRDKYVA